jgi:hypothetical protein
MMYLTFVTSGRQQEHTWSVYNYILQICSVLCFRRHTDGYPSLDERFPLPTWWQAVHVIQVRSMVRILLHKILSMGYENVLLKECTISTKIWNLSQNSTRQRVYMNHASYWGPTKFIVHRTKFSGPGVLAFRFCVPLFVTLHWPRCSLCFCGNQEAFVWAIWGADGGDRYITASFGMALSSLVYLYRRFGTTTMYLF